MKIEKLKIINLKENPMMAAEFGYTETNPPNDLFAVRAVVSFDDFNDRLIIIMVSSKEFIDDKIALFAAIETQAKWELDFRKSQMPIMV